MVMGKIMALDKIKKCIEDNKSFVLQGGAGSGKTETLKQTLSIISDSYPGKKIACITHTNLAVDEIKSRIGEQYTVNTIHSFLNAFIKDYKKNIHQIIFELFRVSQMVRQEVGDYGGDEKNQKKKEHEKYKKLYGKYASSLFTIKNERACKVEGKRIYDQDPESFNFALNDKIDTLNAEIMRQIQEKDYNKIEYNETRFNNFHNLTFGHDGLLDISFLLFEKYPILGKILQDKFDYIFIDEYQDTSEKIIDIFLSKLPNKDQTLVGLFGDSMQAIYEDGIGDVEKYVSDETLVRINKEDNYRCSEQVNNFINGLRSDGLVQEVALKKGSGAEETIHERQGSVELYYAFYKDKPGVRSPQEKKDEYIKALDALVLKALEGQDTFKQLKLTNKSIAFDAGFGKLFSIFSDRYLETMEHIDKHLTRLQFTDLFELCNAYKPLNGLPPNYNLVLSRLKKQGFAIKSILDKKNVKKKFDKIIDHDMSAYQALKEAFDLKLLKESERHSEYLEQQSSFLYDLHADSDFKTFKRLYLDGKTNLGRIKDDLPDLEQEDFDKSEKDVKKEIFYKDLCSPDLKFKEIMNYFNYQSEDTQYITMHKTKGSGIDNVLVVLEEYFWSKYDFKTVFSKKGDLDKKQKTQKLVYVACSRAKTNLKCVRLVSSEEEEKDVTQFFKNHITENITLC